MQNDPSTLTIDRVFHEDKFKANSFGPARWLDDESGYTTLEAALENVVVDNPLNWLVTQQETE